MSPRAVTVWSRDAIGPGEWAHRWTHRVWIPLFYVGCITLGMVAAGGATALSQIFPVPVVVIVSGLFVVAAGVGLFAAVVPVAWRLETGAMLIVLCLLAGYVAAIWQSDVYGRPLPAIVATILLGGPLARLTWLAERIKEDRS